MKKCQAFVVVMVLAMAGFAARTPGASPVAPVAQTGATKSFTVLTIKVTNPGSGFTSAPTVTIAGREVKRDVMRDSLNMAEATVSGGKIASITLTIHGGLGYSPSDPPTVSFSGGGGCPAATAAVSGGAVTGITVKPGEGGSGYKSAPTVVLVGEGTGAAATATVSGGAVTAVAVTKPGSGYKSAPTVSFYGGDGGVAATAEVITPHDDYYWATQGIGVPLPKPRFTNNHDGTVTDNKTGLIWLANANEFGQIPWAQAIVECANLASGAHGLSDGSTAGQWRLPNINEIHSLCSYGPATLTNDQGDAPFGKGPSSFSGFEGELNYWTSTSYLGKPGYAWCGSLRLPLTGWTATHGNPFAQHVLPVRGQGTNGVVPVAQTGAKESFTALSVTVTNPGSGYTSAPTVTISAPGAGTTAKAESTFGGVSSITIVNGGSGYTSVPAVTFSGDTGKGAAAYATLSGGVVTRITITKGGTYTVAPKVIIAPPAAGTAATATAALSGATIGSVIVTYGGSGYSPAAPTTVTISGGGGKGATATVTILSNHDDAYWATQGIGAPLPSPRFTNNHDGTVTDRKTGLIWFANANAFGKVPWPQALAECANLASGAHGLTDGSTAGQWRLPNVEELLSLCNYGYTKPAFTNDKGDAQWNASDVGKVCSFADVQSDGYWTSTCVKSYATYVHLGEGFISFELARGSVYVLPVWPVRGGK